MDDLASRLFASARDRYEAALRWQYLILIALAIFHLTILGPFVALTAEKHRLDRMVAQHEELARTIDRISAPLAAFKDAVEVRSRDSLARVLDDLRSTLRDLGAVVDRLRAMGPESAGGPDGEALFRFGLRPADDPALIPLQMQHPPSPIQEVPGGPPPLGPGLGAAAPLPVMEPGLRRALAEARERHEVLDLVADYVDANLVATALERFAWSWRNEDLPPIQSLAARLQAEVDDATRRFPEWGDVWTAVRNGVDSIARAAAELELTRPADRLWWQTVEGKGAAIDAGAFELSDGVRQLVPQVEALQQLGREVGALLERQNTLRRTLDERLAELERRFEEQQVRVASFAEPLKAVSLDLAVVAPLFPLLLGLLLAVVTAWPASRLQELRDAVDLLGDRGDAATARVWLAKRVASSPATIGVTSAGRCLLFLGWIAAAAVALAGLPGEHARHLTALAILGAVLVVAACLFRWNTACNTLAFAQRPAGA